MVNFATLLLLFVSIEKGLRQPVIFLYQTKFMCLITIVKKSYPLILANELLHTASKKKLLAILLS